MVLWKILTVISPDWFLMIALIGIAVSFGTALYIYKYSDCAYISLAAFITLGMFYTSLGFMRQTLAAIIVTFALHYIDSKQPLRFLVLVLFASCIHVSSLIMIPFYFILRIKLTRRLLSIYSSVSLFLFVFSIPIPPSVSSSAIPGSLGLSTTSPRIVKRCRL